MGSLSKLAATVAVSKKDKPASAETQAVETNAATSNSAAAKPTPAVQEASAGNYTKTETAKKSTAAKKEAQVDEPEDRLSSIVSQITSQQKTIQKKQVSIYLDEDVISELEKFGKKYGKGKRSELVNEFLKSVFAIER